MQRHELWIDGERHAPAGTSWLDVHNPHDGSVVGQVPLAEADAVDRAVAAARGAFPAWAGMPRTERAALLLRIADGLKQRRQQIGEAVAREVGMPFSQAVAGPGRYPALSLQTLRRDARAVPLRGRPRQHADPP